MLSFVYSSFISAPVDGVFAFHEQADALARLTPPWQNTTVLRREGGIREGGIVELLVVLGPPRKKWVALHTHYEPNRLFIDLQKEGPFRFWQHRHEFISEKGGTRLTDRIQLSLPGGPLADFLGGWLARLQLRRLFRYRHQATRQICESPFTGNSVAA